MPAGRLLACEPDGPLGTIIPRGPLCFRDTHPPREERDECPTSSLTKGGMQCHARIPAGNF